MTSQELWRTLKELGRQDGTPAGLAVVRFMDHAERAGTDDRETIAFIVEMLLKNGRLQQKNLRYWASTWPPAPVLLCANCPRLSSLAAAQAFVDSRGSLPSTSEGPAAVVPAAGPAPTDDASPPPQPPSS